MHPSHSSASGNGKRDIVGVFQESVMPYSKSQMALHPHLYDTGLYHRASELKALDALVSQLEQILIETRSQNYKNVPSLLNAIKETLTGKPKLSWWNLFTVSIGHALSTAETDDEQRNEQEIRYLNEISKSLTEIIRSYSSTNTKMLLEIRLTALEVDSRLVELEKMPTIGGESNETLDYLSSEFMLLNEELTNILKSPHQGWKQDIHNLISCISKTNQLMRILQTTLQNQHETYQQFLKKQHLEGLEQKITQRLADAEITSPSVSIEIWTAENLNELFELFQYFPNAINSLNSSFLSSLLIQAEELFVKDTNLHKTRPAIFSSQGIRKYISTKNEEFTKIVEHLRAISKGKVDRTITSNPFAYYRSRLQEENDLHTICAMIQYKPSDYSASPLKSPTQIQKDILLRMRIITSCSQPRELDQVLKSFTHDELATRYYLAQEVMLEQFIFWRKNGIF